MSNKHFKTEVVLSGIQPTGELTLGNYLGAVKNFLALQEREEYQCLYMIADLHALTVLPDPIEIKNHIQKTIALFLSFGLDPKKFNCLIFRQSQILAHGQLFSILNCLTPVGELKRMHQYKEKSKAGEINNGLFSYPVLMASDILLYQTNLVPVGVDQVQHLELAKTLAEKFNNKYGETLTIPQELFMPNTAKIMSLQEPTKKMSKSDSNTKATIFLLDDPKTIHKKIMSAQTDSLNKIDYTQEQSGLRNLINICSGMSNLVPEKIVNQLVQSQSNYSSFKKYTSELIIEGLLPIQKRYQEIFKDKIYLEKVLQTCETQVNLLAQHNIKLIYQRLGLI